MLERAAEEMRFSKTVLKIFINLEEKVREWRHIWEFQVGREFEIGLCLQLATY